MAKKITVELFTYLLFLSFELPMVIKITAVNIMKGCSTVNNLGPVFIAVPLSQAVCTIGERKYKPIPIKNWIWKDKTEKKDIFLKLECTGFFFIK